MKSATLYFILMLISIVPRCWADAVSAESIMERNFYAAKVPHLVSESTMVLINERGHERMRKMHTTMLLRPNGMDSNVLIRFLYPADIQGTGYLEMQDHQRDDEAWVYLPALKKVRRLTANNKQDSFFGSDFSYGDILLPLVDAYRHFLLGAEFLDGEECYVVESVPTREDVQVNYGYSKRISWIRKQNFMEKKVEYHDVYGRPLKIQVVPTVVEVGQGKWWAMRREVHNLQTRHKTILTFTAIDSAIAVSNAIFSSRYLEREQ